MVLDWPLGPKPWWRPRSTRTPERRARASSSRRCGGAKNEGRVCVARAGTEGGVGDSAALLRSQHRTIKSRRARYWCAKHCPRRRTRSFPRLGRSGGSAGPLVRWEIFWGSRGPLHRIGPGNLHIGFLLFFLLHCNGSKTHGSQFLPLEEDVFGLSSTQGQAGCGVAGVPFSVQLKTCIEKVHLSVLHVRTPQSSCLRTHRAMGQGTGTGDRAKTAIALESGLVSHIHPSDQVSLPRARSLTHSLTHPLKHPFARSHDALAHPLTHPPEHSVPSLSMTTKERCLARSCGVFPRAGEEWLSHKARQT